MHNSLQTRLFLLILLAIVPMALLLLYNAFRERRDARQQVEREAQALLSRSVAQQEQLIEGSRQLMASVAGLAVAANSENFNPLACRGALQAVLTDLSIYSNLTITTPRGLVACTAVPQTGFTSVAETAWFQKANQTASFSVGPLEDDPVTGSRALTLAYPIFTSEGNLRSVVSLTLKNDWFQQVASNLELVKGTTFTIYDSSGNVVASLPDANRTAGRSAPDAPEFVAAVRDGSGVESLTGLDNVNRLYAFGPVGDRQTTGLYASVGIPSSAAYAGVRADLARNLLILAAIGLLALVAAHVANELLVLRPIRRLIGVTQRLSGGDLTARARFGAKSGEFGMLAGAFDEMSAALQNHSEENERARDELREINTRLEETIAELKRSNADLEQFAYVASHDLQEPLRTVSSYTQLLSRRYRSQLDRDADDFIDFAVQGAQRMQTLINDLLTFSRVGTRARALRSTDLGDLLDQVLASLKVQLEETGAVVSHDELPAVMGDETQLAQLLQNLIGNAIKFRGEDAPRVHIKAERQGASWLFFVMDNGIGIPADQTDRIFIIFQRLHHRDEYPGTGIGLAISKRIVERHGGRIWVQPGDGGGSTFCFTLPYSAQARRARERGVATEVA